MTMLARHWSAIASCSSSWWHDRRGGIAISAALILPAVLAAAGLGAEVTSWAARRVQMQRVADISALSAAKLLSTGSTNYVAATAALNVAEINGIPAATRIWNAGTNTLSDSYVTVSLVSGVRSTSDQAFKVTVTVPVSLILAKLFVSNSSLSLKASGWAEVIQVAANTPQPCVVGLAKESSPGTVIGVNINGGTSFNSSNCAVRSNSDIAISGSGALTASAIYSGGTIQVNGNGHINAASGIFATNDIDVTAGGFITGNTTSTGNTLVSGGSALTGTVTAGGTITATGSGDVIGNANSTGATTVSWGSVITGNVTAGSINNAGGVVDGTEQTASVTAPTAPGTIPDPYAGNATVQSALSTLSGSSGSAINVGWNANPVVLQPGTYSSITLADWASFSNSAAVTFAPGTYYVNGPVNLQGGTIAGTGVTIISSGPVTVSNGVTVTMTAPLANASTGIPGVLMAGTTASAFNFGGGATVKMSGVLYFPKAALTVSGGVSYGSTACLELIASTVTITGGATVGGNCSSFGATSFSATPSATTVALVE